MSKKETKEEEIIETKETKSKKSQIIVGDPQELRPVELPLVVKPESGEWANEAQAEFARTLNAYAYKNAAKWAEKKKTLVAQLEELGKTPSKIVLYRGNESRLTYKNKTIEN